MKWNKSAIVVIGAVIGAYLLGLVLDISHIAHGFTGEFLTLLGIAFGAWIGGEVAYRLIDRYWK